jgi:hypothetical protein
MLSRHFGKRLKRRQLLRRRERQIHLMAIVHGPRRIRDSLRHVVRERQLVELQQRSLAVAQRQSGTFLDQVVREAIYTAFGELRAWSIACP